VPVISPQTVDDALDALSDTPVHRLLAGGTDEMVKLNHGAQLRQFETVISLSRIPELSMWTLDTARRQITIGAAVSWSQLTEAPFVEHVPVLAQAARTVGSPQIRNAGTIGGNVATASPAGDGLCALVALDALATVRSTRGTRRVRVAELTTGPKRTNLEPDELIVSLDVPLTHGFQGYTKVGVRNAMVISLAGVALVVDDDRQSVSFALGSVGPTILRSPAAETVAANVLFGGTHLGDAMSQLAGAIRETARPIDDHRSTAAYRRHAVGVLATRLIERALISRGASQ
jgi:CO/xanthine dehydrogenase FAD-binding subunit